MALSKVNVEIQTAAGHKDAQSDDGLALAFMGLSLPTTYREDEVDSSSSIATSDSGSSTSRNAQDESLETSPAGSLTSVHEAKPGHISAQGRDIIATIPPGRKPAQKVVPWTYKRLRRRQLPSMLTHTIDGRRMVQQPIESCFDGHVRQTKPDATHAAPVRPRAAVNFTCDEAGDPTAKFGLPNGPSVAKNVPELPDLPPNRTFRNDWLYVAESAKGGYGVFAIRRISFGEDILLEKVLLAANSTTLQKEYDELSLVKKSAYDNLHGHAMPYADTTQGQRIFDTNMFSVTWEHPKKKGLKYANAVFAIASNFNHACPTRRNVRYVWEKTRQCMVFTTISNVEPGEELTISYGGSRGALRQQYGFECRCGGCED